MFVKTFSRNVLRNENWSAHLQHEPHEYASIAMHEITHEQLNVTRTETAEQFRVRLGLEERTFQSRWNRRIGPYDKHHICTQEETELMERANMRLVFDTPPLPDKTPILLPEADATPVFPKKPPGDTIVTKRRETPTVEPKTTVTPVPTRLQWELWVVLSCGLLTSIPNMYAMTVAIKGGDWRTAAGVTAAFTLAPALLLRAGATEYYTRACIVMVIGYEVFCNAASFYGGLTGLNHATFIDPTNFLHMATGFAFNSEYEATARVISVFMSIGIALLVAIPVIKLGKNK